MIKLAELDQYLLKLFGNACRARFSEVCVVSASVASVDCMSSRGWHAASAPSPIGRWFLPLVGSCGGMEKLFRLIKNVSSIICER